MKENNLFKHLFSFKQLNKIKWISTEYDYTQPLKARQF